VNERAKRITLISLQPKTPKVLINGWLDVAADVIGQLHLCAEQVSFVANTYGLTVSVNGSAEANRWTTSRTEIGARSEPLKLGY
jgi:hypothetical protein